MKTWISLFWSWYKISIHSGDVHIYVCYVCLYIYIKMNDKYVYMYRKMYNHISVCVCIHICTFVLNSGRVQTDEVVKSRHCTIAYILLSVARTPQPRLEPAPVHANGPAALQGCVMHGQALRAHLDAVTLGSRPVCSTPYIAGLLDCGRYYAKAVALLISERNYKKIMLRGNILWVWTLQWLQCFFLYLEKVVIVLSRQYTASNIAMGSFNKVLGISKVFGQYKRKPKSVTER